MGADRAPTRGAICHYRRRRYPARLPGLHGALDRQKLRSYAATTCTAFCVDVGFGVRLVFARAAGWIGAGRRRIIVASLFFYTRLFRLAPRYRRIFG